MKYLLIILLTIPTLSFSQSLIRQSTKKANLIMVDVTNDGNAHYDSIRAFKNYDHIIHVDGYFTLSKKGDTLSIESDKVSVIKLDGKFYKIERSSTIKESNAPIIIQGNLDSLIIAPFYTSPKIRAL